MSANTRATRSRFSSPQIATDSSSRGSQAAAGTSGGSSSTTNAGTTTSASNGTTNGADGHKTFMQRWLEPPVQVKASYQDAGLVRQGVFENMAPLGTLPKVGLFKKTAPPPPAPAPEQTPVRKIVIKQKPAAVPSTPVPAPAPEEDETEEDETEEEDDGQTEDQNEGETRDGYEDEGGGAPVAAAAAAASRSRRSVTSGETDDEEWAPAPAAARQNGRARRSVSMASSGSALHQASAGAAAAGADAGSRGFDLGEFVGRVVEAAVDEALAHFRYPTAWALRTLYDENSADRDFLNMMQKVFLQTANADTLQEFARLVEAKKRESKKDKKACHYFVPPAATTNTRFTPHKPKRAPYSHLVKLDMSVLRPQHAQQHPQQQPEQQSQQQQAQEQQQLPQPQPQPQQEAVVKSHKRGRPAKAPAPETERAAAAAPSNEPAEALDTEPELPPRKKRKSGRQQAAAAPSVSAKMSNGKATKAAKAAKTETPSRKRTRARSVSSISSLSSARSLSPPDEVQAAEEDEEEEEEGDGGGGRDGKDGGHDENEGFDETPSRTSPAAAPAPQPIRATKRRRSNAPRRSRNVSPSRPSPAASTAAAAASTSKAAATPAATAAATITRTATPSQRQSPAAALAEDQPYEMPAVVDSPLFPNLNSKKGGKSGTPTIVLATKLGKLDPTDPKQRLRRQARMVTNQSFPLSGIRDASQPPAAAVAVASSSERDDQDQPPATPATTTLASRSRTTLPSARPTPAPREGRSTRSALKRTYDDLEDQPSPTAGLFPGSAAASTAADSRAGTPALRPAKKPRTGLRVKNSPMKKKNGTSAGIPRPSGERSSPVGNAPREDDNDDYCSSCGGNGELICCDGCTRSFHFSCVDPVLSQDAMPVEWFCNVCRTGRDAARLPVHDGSFAQMLEKLDAKNSSAFRLPGPVRNRFEGVRTGVDGEYEDITNVVKPPPRKKKNEEDQPPDLFRIRDNDGNAIICHSCQQGSAPDRAIITCSVCALYWHLDCLDPPLPYPPVLRTWKCPLHTDDLLVSRTAVLGPAHKYRKVKDAPVIRPTFSRGYVNNGFVEVDLDEGENESGWRDIETYGRTVRLNEKGIKLDFLSRIWGNSNPNPNPKPAAAAAPAPLPLDQRSLEEQRAALNLAQLSGNRDDGISTLINAMISQADPSVVDIMGRADPTHLAGGAQIDQMDQQSLRAMLSRAESVAESIRQLLATGAPQPALPQPAAAATPTAVEEEAPVLAPTSPATPQSPEPESDNSAAMNADSSAMELDAPASPATTDDVPAMTQGEKTPVLGDQSPAAPLPLMGVEEGAPVENGEGPVTPTKAAAVVGEEPVVMGEGEGGDGEKMADCEGGLME